MPIVQFNFLNFSFTFKGLSSPRRLTNPDQQRNYHCMKLLLKARTTMPSIRSGYLWESDKLAENVDTRLLKFCLVLNKIETSFMPLTLDKIDEMSYMNCSWITALNKCLIGVVGIHIHQFSHQIIDILKKDETKHQYCG